MAKDKLSINSFNCRGLRDSKKRNTVFNWLQTKHSGLTLLQETHSIQTDEKIWENESVGQIFFSHGTCQSRGVAILIPHYLQEKVKIKNMRKDDEGRIIILECQIEGSEIILVNIYAPTKDQQAAQVQFLNNLTALLQEFIGKNLIIAGDFNTYLNCKLDKKGGRIEGQSNYSKAINAFYEQLSLTDNWRIRNPTQLKFTRRDYTRAGLVQSRLDYFLVSMQIGNQISNCTIKPGFKSDHSLLQIAFDLLGTQTRGRSYWKFNNNLLHDKTYICMIKDEIKSICQTVNTENKNTLWEFAKCQIRTVTISYAKALSKHNKERESFLQKKLEILENSLTEYSQNTEYHAVKAEWELFQTKKIRSSNV